LTKPYNVRLEDQDGVEVERLMMEDDRDASYVIRFLVHEALTERQNKADTTAVKP